MDLEVYTAQDGNQVMEALEEYIHKCFRGAMYWFDQGDYSSERISPLESKFKFDFIKPLTEYLDILYEPSIMHQTGFLNVSGSPSENKIYIEYKNESIRFTSQKHRSGLKLFFSPLMVPLGLHLLYPNTIGIQSDVPLANKKDKVYFFRLSKDVRAKLEATSRKNLTSYELELKKYKEEWQEKDNMIDYLNKVEQIHESFLLLPDPQLVFCNFSLSDISFLFRWLVLNPELALYPRLFSDKIESNLSKSDVNNMLIFGWTFQMYFEFS